MGLDGEPRDLHIDKGVKVANVTSLPKIAHPWAADAPVVTLVECPYFKTNLHHLGSRDGTETTLHTNGRFHALTCIGGEVTVTGASGAITLHNGQTALVPAVAGQYTMVGTGDVIRSWQTGVIG